MHIKLLKSVTSCQISFTLSVWHSLGHNHVCPCLHIKCRNEKGGTLNWSYFPLNSSHHKNIPVFKQNSLILKSGEDEEEKEGCNSLKLSFSFHRFSFAREWKRVLNVQKTIINRQRTSSSSRITWNLFSQHTSSANNKELHSVLCNVYRGRRWAIYTQTHVKAT